MKELNQQCPRVDVRQYVGRWVALDPETHEVLADGSSLSEAWDKAIEQGTDQPLLMMVPQSEGFFVGLA